MPFVLPFLLWPFALLFLLVWLVRRKVLTWQRVLVLWPIFAIMIADLALTPVLYLLPKTVWPPLKPAMRYPELLAYLAKPLADGRMRICHMVWDLWREHPPGFWFTQIPWALVAFPLLRWAWRSGWPAKRGEPEAAKVATHGSARWAAAQRAPRYAAAGELGQARRGGCSSGLKDRPGLGDPLVYHHYIPERIDQKEAERLNAYLFGRSSKKKTR
ncbi:MAG: hypothetical protein QHH27_06230 [Clostridia bacterium]|jgi:hypothetical protein|nr:hypothetical protein [Clostridia bacterium]MDH7573134.1 hypothetical protein [Clostridia bacterium]